MSRLGLRAAAGGAGPACGHDRRGPAQHHPLALLWAAWSGPSQRGGGTPHQDTASLLRCLLGSGRGASPPGGTCRPMSPFPGIGGSPFLKGHDLHLCHDGPKCCPMAYTGPVAWADRAWGGAEGPGHPGRVALDPGQEAPGGLLSGAATPGCECTGALGCVGRTGRGLEAPVMSTLQGSEEQHQWSPGPQHRSQCPRTGGDLGSHAMPWDKTLLLAEPAPGLHPSSLASGA